MQAASQLTKIGLFSLNQLALQSSVELLIVPQIKHLHIGNRVKGKALHGSERFQNLTDRGGASQDIIEISQIGSGQEGVKIPRVRSCLGI